MTKKRSHLYINSMHCALWYSHFIWLFLHSVLGLPSYVHKWYWVGFMRCYQAFSSHTHTRIHSGRIRNPFWSTHVLVYSLISDSAMLWIALKMAIGILVVYFFCFFLFILVESDMCTFRLYWSRWPYFQKENTSFFHFCCRAFYFGRFS